MNRDPFLKKKKKNWIEIASAEHLVGFLLLKSIFAYFYYSFYGKKMGWGWSLLASFT